MNLRLFNGLLGGSRHLLRGESALFWSHHRNIFYDSTDGFSTHKDRHISIEATKKVSFGALHAVPPLYNEVLQHNANMLLGVRERMVKRRAHRSDRAETVLVASILGEFDRP